MRQAPRPQLTATKRAQLTAHPRRHGSLGLEPAGFRFSETRHHLTPAQVRQANQRLRHLERTRPIREHAKMALRIAGIVSAVRRGVIGSTAFGRRLHAHRGGRVMKLHGAHILQEIYPVGLLAIQIARERKIAAQYYETHGEPLPLGAKPTDTMEQQRLRDLTELWEQSEWQTQRDRLSW